MGLFDKWAGRVTGFFDDVLLPEELHVTLMRARQAVEAEQYARALDLLEVIDARKPGLSRVHALQGMARMGLGDYAGAASRLRSAAALRPEPRTLMDMALALELGGDAKAARETLRQAMRLAPSRAETFEIQHGLGRAHLALHRPDKAVRELRKALRSAEGWGEEAVPSSSVAEARVTLGRALMQRSAVEEALETLEAVLPEPMREGDAAPDDDVRCDALWLYGRALVRSGRGAQALRVMRHVAAQRGDDVEALLDAGRAALAAQRAEEARAIFAQASEQTQTEAGRVAVWTLQAQASLALGRPEEALRALSQALTLRPDDLDALRVSGEALVRQVEVAEGVAEALAQGEAIALSDDMRDLLRDAEARFRRLRERDAHDAGALHGLGRCRLLLGDAAGAYRALRDAHALRPDDDVMRASLGAALVRVEEAPQAVAALRELLTDTADAETRAMLEGLLALAYRKLSPDFAVPQAEVRDIVAVSAAARSMRDWIARTPRLVDLLDRAQALHAALDAPLDVAFVGEFNAGKSTLVNAFVGEKVVPMGVLPTTAHVNVMRFGPRRAAQLHMRDGRVEEVAFGDVKRRVKGDEDAIDHIEYLYPHPDLRRIHIWDTPGFNSPNAAHEAHARTALKRAEVIFWVCDASQALTDSEKERIDTLPEPDERLVVLLNKVDRLGFGDDRAAAVAEVEAHTREALDGRLRGVFAVSGREGLQARLMALDGDPSADEALGASGLGALLDFAHAEVFDRAGQFKATIAVRVLRELARDIHQRGGDLAQTHQTRIEGLRALGQRWLEELGGLKAEVIATEQRRMRDGVDFLLTLVAREIREVQQPSSRLIDALIPRPELEPEDMEFVLELLVERFGALLDRSYGRVTRQLIAAEQRFIDGCDPILDALDPADARRLRARLEASINDAQAARALLAQTVYARDRWVAQGRTTGPEVDRLLLRQAADREASDAERKAALARLLPPVADTLAGDLERWLDDSVQRVERTLERILADLGVVLIEAQALTDAFPDATLSDAAARAPQQVDPV